MHIRSLKAVMPRVLVMAHAHPALSAGGGEIAAHAGYRALRMAGAPAWFLAGGSGRAPARLGAVLTQPFGPDEFIYHGGQTDFFLHANRDPEFPAEFAALLRRLWPDVLHAHHFVHLGIEALLVARRTLPHLRIVMTLHDMAAICHNHGQMLTRPARRPCTASGPLPCHACYPDITTGAFALRRRYISRFLALVDGFIAPSHFIARRHAEWGLPAERIAVIDNILPPAQPEAPPLAMHAQEKRGRKGLRVGFFGQISPFKGVGLLLDAAALIAARADAPPIEIEIHGDGSNQNPELRAELAPRLAAPPPHVRVHGAYAQAQVGRLMQRVDVVVVPSLWWENAPLVIEEALRARRPVICADIGGMAEKIRDGQDGLHFPAGDAAGLAEALCLLAAQPKLLAQLQATLRPPADPAAALVAHLELYRGLLAASGGLPGHDGLGEPGGGDAAGGEVGGAAA